MRLRISESVRLRRLVFGLLCEAAAAVSVTLFEVSHAAQLAEGRMARRREAARLAVRP